MKKTYTRFLGVAIVVCLFAVAMATLLNYYKYKSTVEGIVRDRVLLIANGIDSSVQSSLALGIGFGELTMLPPLLERERAADRLVSGIEVFDPEGKILYATSASAINTKVPAAWVAAAVQAKGDWAIDDPTEFVAGITLRNNFNLTVGYLAMRYARAEVDRNVHQMGREISLIGLTAFAAVSLLVCGALIVVLNRFERDMHAVERAIAGQENNGKHQMPDAFAGAVEELQSAIREADADLARLREHMPKPG
jgi:hypothetical protein